MTAMTRIQVVEDSPTAGHIEVTATALTPAGLDWSVVVDANGTIQRVINARAAGVAEIESDCRHIAASWAAIQRRSPSVP